MSKKVAVVLAGCGVYDGAEIHEAVLTLLRLDQAGAEVQCFAPNMQQLHVVNHLTGEVAAGETRNVLVEAARIARGNIRDLAEANPEAFDAVIVPGGFGAAKNLCDFAVAGPALTIHPDFQAFIEGMRDAGKPVGLICIAPAMTGRLFGKGAECTIGNDAETAAAIEKTGASHFNHPVDEIHLDGKNRLVTTPAYMLAGGIGQAAAGINKLVDKILDLA